MSLALAAIIYVGNMRDQQRRATAARAAAQHAAQVAARMATVEDAIVNAQHAIDKACDPLFSGLNPYVGLKEDDLRLEVKKYYTTDRNSYKWRVYQCADAF